MHKKYLSLANPKYWPAWLGVGLLWLITRLPYNTQIKIGERLGKFLYLFPSKLKHTTETNIKLCFPEYTPEQCAALAKKKLRIVGRGIN